MRQWLWRVGNAGVADVWRLRGWRAVLTSARCMGLWLVLLLSLFCLPVSAQSPGGHWKIRAIYSGGASATKTQSTPSMDEPNTSLGSFLHNGASYFEVSPDNPNGFNLSSYPNSPSDTSTGTFLMYLNALVSRSLLFGYGTLQQQSTNAQVKLELEWVLDDPNAPELPPLYILVAYRRTLSVGGTLYTPWSNQSVTGSGQVWFSAGEAPALYHSGSGSANGSVAQVVYGSNKQDPGYYVKRLLVTGLGTYYTATLPLNFGWQTDLAVNTGVMGYPSHNAYGTSGASAAVEIIVVNQTPSRGSGPGSGNTTAQPKDPSFTRWLPLDFSPLLSSQPFRTQAGALPAPWGNLNCYYSIRMHEEDPANPNLDLEGYFLPYRPSGVVYLMLPGLLVPKTVITDASGERLVFDSQNAAYPDVHSTFSGGGLSNAGPPGGLKGKGNYTYTFQTTSGMGQLLKARLSSIQDSVVNPSTGQPNRQTLYWNDSAGLTTPFLTVVDSSSGRQLWFYRNASGYVSKVVAPADVLGTPFTRTELDWDGSGHMTRMRVYQGNGTTPLSDEVYTYDGDAIASVSQGSQVSSATYIADLFFKDPFGTPVKRVATQRLGSTSDSSPSSDSSTLGVSGLWTYSYGNQVEGYNDWGAITRTQRVTDPANYAWDTLYHLSDGSFGSLTGMTSTGPPFTGTTQSSQSVVTFTPTYANPNLVTFTDGALQSWQVEINAEGHVTKYRNCASKEWTFAYDGPSNDNGKNLTSLTDPTNVSWSFLYGESGAPLSRLTSLKDANSLTRMSIGYNGFGQPTSLTIPSTASASGWAEVTTLAYDEASGKGDLLSIQDPLGDYLTIDGYDPLGDPTSVSVYPNFGVPTTNPAHKMTASLVWDATQRMQSATLPNGVQLLPTYTEGNLTTMQVQSPTGATLSSATLSYDSRGRVYKVEDGLGVLARFRYDQRGYLTRVYDGRSGPTLGNMYQTRFSYGANGELAWILWPLGTSVHYRYDVTGRLVYTRDERGLEYDYHYNTASYLDWIKVRANAAAGTVEEKVEYFYDEAGRLELVKDWKNGVVTGTRDYVYTGALKRLTSVVTTIAALPAPRNTFTLSYDYKPDGSVWKSTSLLGVSEYTYDKAGQLVSLSDPFGDVTNWSYDHAGRLLSELTTTYNAATVKTEFGWGVSGIVGDTSVSPVYLRTLNETVNNQTFWNQTFTRSYLGKITNISGNGGGSGQTQSGSFSYDSRGRLTGESQSISLDGQSTSSVSGSYTYDLANNLNAGGNGWVYNTNAQLTSAPASGGLAGATGLTYDACGNLKTINGNTLTYDAWGRLASISGPNGSISYTYDGAGRMLSRTSGGVTSYFLYEGNTLLAELDSQGYLMTGYVWGANGLVSQHTANLIILEGSGLEEGLEGGEEQSLGWPGLPMWDSLYYLFDGLGNTRGLTDANGSVVGRSSFSGWGGNLQILGTVTPFARGGQFGGWTENVGSGGSGALVLSGQVAPRVYVPGTGQYGTPSGVGFGGGAHPYANPGVDGVNEAPDAGVDSVLAAERARWGGVNQLAGQMEMVLETAAGFNPACSAAMAFSGYNAAGKRIGWGQRLLNGLGAIPGVGIGGAADDVVRTAKAASTTNKWERRVQKVKNLVEEATDGCFGSGVVVQQPAGDLDTTENSLSDKKTSSGTRVASQKAGKSKVGTGTDIARAASKTTPIPTIQQNALVYCRDEKTGKDSVKRVVSTSVRTVFLTVDIGLADARTGKIVEILTTTREHPFYVEGKGFVPAGGLAVGNQIVTRAGPPLVVASLDWKRHAEGVPVYNFVVEGDHTYFVGNTNGGAWVHNNDCSLFDEADLPPVTQAPTRHEGLKENMLAIGQAPPFPDAQVHHGLPWELKEEFAERGISVNDAEFGWYVGANHQSWSHEYTQKWKAWLKSHPKAGIDEVRKVIEKIKKHSKYGVRKDSK